MFSENGALEYEGPFGKDGEPTEEDKLKFARRQRARKGLAQALSKAHARVMAAPEVVTTWHGLLEHEKYAPGAAGYLEAERSFNEAAL